MEARVDQAKREVSAVKSQIENLKKENEAFQKVLDSRSAPTPADETDPTKVRETQLEYLVEQTRRRAQTAEDKMLSLQLDVERQERTGAALTQENERLRKLLSKDKDEALALQERLKMLEAASSKIAQLPILEEESKRLRAEVSQMR